MGFTSMLTLMLTHPFEFRTLVQYYLYHQEKRDITSQQEHPTTGWDRKSMRQCWELLDLTSRSFSSVIKELDGDLARAICLFYLVLRGLDTIEDDMTLPDAVKQPLLRSFHEKTVQPGWHFDGSGPEERDRELLVQYAVVVEEINLLAPEYREVVLSICQKMEVGMADFAHAASLATPESPACPRTVQDYDLYCHYVAGVVGEGLSGIWSASGKEVPWLKDQLELSNSMGLLLQKTNIIRDVHEDADDGRFFWPQEIWGAFGFAHPRELCAAENRTRAMWVQSAMVLDALRHAEDSLDYLRLLKNQSVFNFCAIPAAMAMATLELCFMNGEMFERNVKIRKAEAASLIMRATNPREVAYMFRDYARKIHAKAVPTDPSFLRICVACGKIEQWGERHFPSFIQIGQRGGNAMLDVSDPRSRVVEADAKRDQELAKAQRVADIKREIRAHQNGTGAAAASQRQGNEPFPKELLFYMIAAFVLVIAFSFGMIYAILWFLGEADSLPSLPVPQWFTALGNP